MEEVLRRGQILMQQKFQVLEVFMVVAILYLVMTTCWDFVQRRIEATTAATPPRAATGARRSLIFLLPKRSWGDVAVIRDGGVHGPSVRERRDSPAKLGGE